MTYEWNPTPAERSILGQIRRQQSRDQYNVLFGFTHFDGWSAFPQWAGITYRGRITHAAGAYQDEPATWIEITSATGVSDFSPASQDIGNLWLLRTYGQQSQWGITFTDDGGYYVFAADAPPVLPPPTEPGEPSIITVGGTTWTGKLTKTAGAMLLGAGLGVGGMASMPAPPVPLSIMQMVQAADPGSARLAEFETCYRLMRP